MSSPSDQQPPATKVVSWADKARAAKAAAASADNSNAATSTINNTPAAIITAPEIRKPGEELRGDTKIDNTHTLLTLPEADKGTLVLDTNAFIKGFDNFLATADVFVTTSAVIQECRDRKTRDLLDRLPVSIEILEPSPESMKKVINIAEKTGDVGMLSKTDLALCALALDVAQLRKALLPEISPGSAPVNSNETVDVDDSDFSDDEEYEETSDDEDSSSSDDGNWLDASSSDDDTTGKKKDKKKKKTNKKKDDHEKKKSDTAAIPSVNLPGWGTFEDDWGAPDQGQETAAMLSKKQQKKLAKQQQSEGESAPTAAATPASSAAPVEKKQPEEQKETQVELLARTKASNAYTGGFSCVTSDFPMQNVLLHCGVPTVGTNGQCIRELRVWVLRCHACASIIHDTVRQFCPECGSGDTLKRVHYVMNEKGEKHLFVNFRHRISTRGTIFNLSKPRGGRKGTNKTMVLREDQLRNCGKVDAKERFMNQRDEIFYGGAGGGGEDGLAGFGDRDSRAGRRDGNFMMEKSSYKKKNVTEARKVRASRKR